MPIATYGLTGGIASGKSLAVTYFGALGVPTCDTDQFARDVIAPGTPGERALRDAIGDMYFNTEGLSRARLRAALFQDPDLKHMVESIVHPRVRDAVQTWQTTPKPGAPYQIVCSPLLLETASRDSQGVIVVDLPESLQIARGIERDGTSAEEIQRIMTTQRDRASRLAKADFILDNSGTRDDLQKQVVRLHQTLKDCA